MNTAERFWAKVDIAPDSDACWLWTASVFTASGYGQFDRTGAHRKAWELTNGPIPDGLCVLHHCDVKKCVNPKHLYVGTHRQNIQDMDDRGRRNHNRARLRQVMVGRNWIGANHPGAKLTDEQIREVRRLIREGNSQSAIAQKFSVSQSLISRIEHGHRKDA